MELIPSPVTYFHNMDTEELRRIRVLDRVAPLLFSRTANPRPDRPDAPGPPTGPFIDFALSSPGQRLGTRSGRETT
ncbi:hypothetical protein CLV97_12838 [Planifilum fimeticola]|uniref:Uncharacterized protein n=1 Tax=Planifilum fimeticola TaxID=201975 RepID=A0A2T0LBF5_9BACL|nr:hypothetical protein CLV97_12838 [Planifilum fimeticola]